MNNSSVIQSLKSLILIGSVGIGALLYACDTVKPPTTTTPSDTTRTTTTTTTTPTTSNPGTGTASAQPDTNVSLSANRLVPKALLEKYTGFRCGLCPAGADDLKALESAYPTTLIGLNIHASSLATPSGAPFMYDFRTVSGNSLDNQFRATGQGLPSALINRVAYNSTLVLTRGAWSAAIAAQNMRTLEVAVSLASYYSPTSRTVTIRATIEYLKNQDADNYISLFVVEDGIVQPQIDYRLSQTTIPNYSHEHVLRGTMNGTWGTQLSTTAIPAGTTLTKEISSVLPAEWNERRCSVIALVHKYNTTWQVLQVEKVRIRK